MNRLFRICLSCAAGEAIFSRFSGSDFRQAGHQGGSAAISSRQRLLGLAHARRCCRSRRAHRHVKVFVAEKHFEGCGGLEMTEEIRVTIAAQACVLLVHRETDPCEASVSPSA